jgi:hypothetical protein
VLRPRFPMVSLWFIVGSPPPLRGASHPGTDAETTCKTQYRQQHRTAAGHGLLSGVFGVGILDSRCFDVRMFGLARSEPGFHEKRCRKHISDPNVEEHCGAGGFPTCFADALFGKVLCHELTISVGRVCLR